MTTRAATRPLPEGVLDIKGTMSPVTVLRLRDADPARVEAELRTRVVPHPQIFLQAPVVLDVAQLDGATVKWDELVKLLRDAKLVPVGVSGASPEETEQAVAAGLGVVQLGGKLRSVEAPDEPAPLPPPPVAEVKLPMIVNAPVRGGQVVYARGGDLTVVASVNPGAQVIADGSVQIWGPLRGRALAGAQGRKDARILCLALEAELVSVAGEYLSAEEIPDKLRGKPARVFLDGDRVRIAEL